MYRPDQQTCYIGENELLLLHWNGKNNAEFHSMSKTYLTLGEVWSKRHWQNFGEGWETYKIIGKYCLPNFQYGRMGPGPYKMDHWWRPMMTSGWTHPILIRPEYSCHWACVRQSGLILADLSPVRQHQQSRSWLKCLNILKLNLNAPRRIQVTSMEVNDPDLDAFESASTRAATCTTSS